MKKVILFSIFLIFGQELYAAAWSNPLTVEYVTTYGKSDMLLLGTSDASAKAGVYADGCTANRWVIDSDNEERRNRFYSTLMAAKVSGKTVSLWYGDDCGIWGYHITSVVQFN